MEEKSNEQKIEALEFEVLRLTAIVNALEKVVQTEPSYQSHLKDEMNRYAAIVRAIGIRNMENAGKF